MESSQEDSDRTAHTARGGHARYVFGPVPSRRLGRSLGVDTIPFKTCNWNCVYCQLGRTRHLVNERRTYVPVADVLSEVEQTLARHRPGEIDWVTFVGSGEPLLHKDMGLLLRGIKALTDIPVAVVTNGSLLHLPEVRRDILPADVVLPSIDAGTAKLYRRINRPHPGLDFGWFVDGLEAFRREYAGRLWAEVMLIGGVNDGEEALEDIRRVLEKVQPEAVHVNTPVRPAGEAWVQAPAPKRTARALQLFGLEAGEVPAMVSNAVVDEAGDATIDLAETILAVISRHPLAKNDLPGLLGGRTQSEIDDAVVELEASGRVQVVVRHDRCFLAPAGGRYACPAGGE